MRVLGHRVLLEMIEDVRDEKKSDGGIILAVKDKVFEEDSEIGIVVQIGTQAYKEVGDGTPWVKIGDKVTISRYAGLKVKHPTKVLRLINDEDVKVEINDYEV